MMEKNDETPWKDPDESVLEYGDGSKPIITIGGITIH